MAAEGTCGRLFTNEEGELAICVLTPHGDPFHCDGVDRAYEFEDMIGNLDLAELSEEAA